MLSTFLNHSFASIHTCLLAASINGSFTGQAMQLHAGHDVK